MVDCLSYFKECLCLLSQSYIDLHLIYRQEYHNYVKRKHTVLISMLELIVENMIKCLLAFNTNIVYGFLCYPLQYLSSLPQSYIHLHIICMHEYHNYVIKTNRFE